MGRVYQGNKPNAFLWSKVTEPTGTYTGDLWYDESSSTLKVKGASGFSPVSEGGEVASPFTGSQAPGSCTVSNGQFAIQGCRLTLAGAERVTLEGTGRLILCG